jgi:toxin secretion/phage lysis holin
MKEGILTAMGIAGGFVATALGGFDAGLVALVTFMGIDYLTGLIVAGVFRKSGKSGGGGLESGAGFKGLIKKGMCLLFILIAVQLDTVIGSDFVRDAAIIAFISNELISIVENAGMMGVPIPAVISRAIDVLNRKGGEG